MRHRTSIIRGKAQGRKSIAFCACRKNAARRLRYKVCNVNAPERGGREFLSKLQAFRGGWGGGVPGLYGVNVSGNMTNNIEEI
jgi:hypothetical protein